MSILQLSIASFSSVKGLLFNTLNSSLLDFCKFSINHKAFVSGDFDTHFVDLYLDEFLQNTEQEELLEAGAVVAYEAHQEVQKKKKPMELKAQSASLWKTKRRDWAYFVKMLYICNAF